MKTLGADYTEEAITERISGERIRTAKTPRAEKKGVSLLIDIENSIKAGESRGYEQWAKIHNLKQTAKTLNFLTENKIEQYADLVSRIEEVTTASEQASDALKSSIILHEAAAKALKTAGISGKLPNVTALQADYAKLQDVR